MSAGEKDYTSTITGTVLISGPVTVTGAVTVTGTVAISGSVTVTGTVAISGTVTVSGAVTVSGTVAVSGTVTVTGTVAVSGTVTISGSVTVTGTTTISGAVTITSGSVTFTNTTIAVTGTVSISGTVTVDGAVTVSGTVAVSGTVTVTGAVTVTGTVAVSGTVTVSGTVAVSGTVTVSGAVTVTGTVAVSGTVTVSGTVAISGSVTITGTVAISGTVTISGAVTITSGAVTITTVGGTNIVIDKLTTSAYTENKRFLTNDVDPTPPASPQYTIAETGYIGKFFPRGCRGQLAEIRMYCKRTSTGTITVKVSPHPSLGELYSTTITPGADWGWVAGRIDRFWSYDSLFIWFSIRGNDVSIGIDGSTPYDGYTSTDSGVTWGDISYRPYYRAGMAGQTIGDLPISGTINTIEIPSLGGTTLKANTTITANATTTLFSITGSGKAVFCLWLDGEAGLATETDLSLVIVRDGITIMDDQIYNLSRYCGNITDSAQPLTRRLHNVAIHNFAYAFPFPFGFKRSLVISIKNTHATKTSVGWGYCQSNIVS